MKPHKAIHLLSLAAIAAGVAVSLASVVRLPAPGAVQPPIAIATFVAGQ